MRQNDERGTLNDELRQKSSVFSFIVHPSSFILWLLRGLSFLLLASALAGIHIERDATQRTRVLVSFARSRYAGVTTTSNDSGDKDQAVKLTVDTLHKKQIEGVVAESSGTEIGWAEIVERGGPFRAAILLTDGAISAEDARHEIDRASAASGGAPVYVLTGLRQSDPPGVALESVMVVGHPAAPGVPVAVRCTAHARGMGGRESLVTISDDAKVQASTHLMWTSDSERQTVTLDVVPKVAGWTDYTAHVEAAGGEEGAVLSRPFALYAEQRRMRVLFFEGEPTWEAKFIRHALEQSGLFDIDYFAQVSRAATAGLEAEGKEQKGRETVDTTNTNAGETATEMSRSGEAKGSPEAKLHAALASTSQLNAYDCIIIGATPNTMLSATESARLRAWAERRGGGLIVLGGNSFAGSIAAPNGKLYTLLPTEIDQRGLASESRLLARGMPQEAEVLRHGIPLTPTEAGAAGGGALRGYGSVVEEAAGAKSDVLTGEGLRLGALRAGAIVLAVAGQPNANGTSEAGTPLIAAMRDGAGRVLVFAPADSWRMRMSRGDERDETGGPFGALWQGLTLWSAAGARPPVEIGLSDESPAAGHGVTAEIHVRDRSFAPLKIEKVNARLQPLTGEAVEGGATPVQPQEVAFAPDPVEASVWRARMVAPVPGRFVLEADYVAGGRSGSASKYFTVVQSSPFEAGAAGDTLRRAARESGGDVFTAADLSALVERIKGLPRSGENVHYTWELRTWWPLALMIPVLLSIEWFARRWIAEDEI